MNIVSLSVGNAQAYLSKFDRHYRADADLICAIGVGESEGGKIVLHGAALLGQNSEGDGELVHIYVDGTSQGYSLLYGACWRALKALGYKRAVL